MELTQIEEELFGKLAPFFERYGFAQVRAFNQFRRPTDNGFQNMILAFSPCNGETWIEAFIGIRLDMVEQLAYPFTTGMQGFRRNSNTLVTSFGRLQGQPYKRFCIKGAKCLSETRRSISDFMIEQGFEFLDKYTQLHEIDHLWNATPQEPCPYAFNQAHRCIRGLVVARLASQYPFEDVREAYRKQMEQHVHLLPRFDKLATFLEAYSPN
ncbi:hypothetical protein SAMN05421823_103367 [Catalinimonas alkaloidigena]|uniref:Uncharacterized protein n=1 Tax=Catalinimonas alkaloidigena TaxID=1075417 RepID=A0A1G9E6N2_9BACT|nr:hypothetical protein [Catalinimonas alkaloidigena]SDK71812.1 hypothetical protein SAMN05421823_103367 [Catalinimonas alkaloidigena]